MGRNAGVQRLTEGQALTQYLTVIKEVEAVSTPNGTVQRRVLTKCICGVEKVIRLYTINSGLTISCGCARQSAPPLSVKYIMDRVRQVESGCWEWQKSRRTTNGYGQASFKGPHGRAIQMQAHRAAWVAFKGPIPDNLWVLHKCNNRPCCNPEHLYVGTPSENGKDRWRNPANNAERNRLREAIREGALKEAFGRGRKIGQPRATMAALQKRKSK